MKTFLDDLQYSLEKIDHYRDELLFLFIKPYWPKKISPNQITYVRITAGIVLFILLFFFKIENKALILSLFCLGVISDLFDGSVARALKKETELGAMLDPAADRILIIPIAVYSLYESHKWLLLILFLVEIFGALVSIYYKSKEAYKANIFGKARMVLLSIVFAVILIVWPEEPSLFFIDVLWASLIFSVLSILTRMSDLSHGGFIKNKIISKQLNRF